jgi:deazaflavin-dependent oxidoreductase (nitroreductase family)
VLINNAGTASGTRELTVDGLEKTFATNHLGPFLLTELVLDLLAAGPAGRVVNTVSETHPGRIEWDNLQGERHYSFFSAYARSKAAQILFTYELARRLDGTGITANCFTPGPTATGFGRGTRGFIRMMSGLVNLIGRRPEVSARTAVYLATSPEMEGVTGQYFFHDRPARSKPVTYDSAIATQLWSLSEELTRVRAHTAMEADQMSTAVNAINLGPRARRIVRFVAAFVNPIVLLLAGRWFMPVVGILRHRGRRSGRMYATPIAMRPLGDGFVIPRTFGDNAAWYLNIKAAGNATVKYLGRTYELIDPQVVDFATAKPASPRYELLQFRLIGINEYLRLRVAPGAARIGR